MKGTTWLVTPAVALALLAIPLLAAADPSGYVPPAEARAKIKAYYDDVYRSVVRRVYLLEIVRDEDDAELIHVYFLKDRDPKEVDDPRGNITSDSAPVLRATFHYSYLGGEWRIKEIKRYRGRIVFRYED